jgi:5-methyltetrahydropteroyltriglutamate--homocysteine methyltransferase
MSDYRSRVPDHPAAAGPKGKIHMKRSTDRILTSHVGSLPRPQELLDLYGSGANGDALATGVGDAVRGVVQRQLDLGIDVVNDGEYGKPMTEAVDYSAFQFYSYTRLSGYELRKVPMSWDMFGGGRDFADFADFYGSGEVMETADSDASADMPVNVGEVSYMAHELARRDITNLKAALPNGSEGAAFLTSMAAGTDIYELPSEHYEHVADLRIAQAEAMREEFKLIADAGLIVQLDDPWLVDSFGTQEYSANGDIAGYRKWAQSHVELVNHSIEGIPSDQIRLHVCWGSWKGPHSSDVPLKDAIDLLLSLNVGLYSVEAANPMHEHEWRVWEEVDLPEEKILMPGVVTHKTNVLEHPEVVADRIVRYAKAVGRESVIAGTDCGMGGRIHPTIAWAKLKRLVEGAEIASTRLWS